jgi:lycopene beta-cyclase
VGAGAAGLSLACHLAESGWDGEVLLVDDGSHPIDQRSWAWWTTGNGLLDSAASTAVDHLEVAGPGWRRTLELAPYSYRRISGPELLAATSRLTEARSGYRHVQGSVRALTQEGDTCRVTIDIPKSGTTRTVEVSARWVFDSVGLGASTEAPTSGMQLDFLGLHVECPKDTFESGTATLMDFRTDQSSGVAFMYVLPTSARSALVERTVFAQPRAADPRVTECDQEELVVEYLTQCLGVGSYRVTGREIGVIPLDRRPRATPKGSMIPIGARAGMVKASTGYGFERIQRHSAAIASCLAEGRSPVHAVPTHRWNRALDNALLTVLRDDPADALSFFETLLTRNPVQRVLAFLDEDASLRTQLQLFATLPMAPFARSQARVVTPQWRQGECRERGRVLPLQAPRRGR